MDLRQGYMVVQGRWHTVVGTNSKVLHKAFQVPLINKGICDRPCSGFKV